MIRINLLLFKVEKKKENIKRQLSIYFLSIIFLLLFCTYINQNQNQKLSRLQALRDVKRKELIRYEKINRKIGKLKRKIEECQKKIDIIKKIARYRLEPIRILDEMVIAIPPNSLWLNSLRLSGNRLYISGSAKDNDTIAYFMKKLRQMPRISKVELKVSRLTALSSYGINICEFDLECITKVPKKTQKRQ